MASGTKLNQGRTAGRLKLNLASRWTICTLPRTSFTPLIASNLTTNSRFLNPEVYENCTNLQANVYYCVEAVGSISTYPGYGATTSATQAFAPTDCTALPWRHIMDNHTGDLMKPLAEGTRPDCYQYGRIHCSPPADSLEMSADTILPFSVYRYLVIPSAYYERNLAKNCWGTTTAWDISPAVCDFTFSRCFSDVTHFLYRISCSGIPLSNKILALLRIP